MKNRSTGWLLILGVAGMATMSMAQEVAVEEEIPTEKKQLEKKKYPIDGIIRKVKRGHLGIIYAPTNRWDRRRRTVVNVKGFPRDAGIGIGSVTENSPAAKAGLKTGDVLMKINGQVVVNDDQLKTLLNIYREKEVTVNAFRQGEEVLELKATIESKEVESIDWELVRSLLKAAEADGSPEAKEFRSELRELSESFARRRQRERWEQWRAIKNRNQAQPTPGRQPKPQVTGISTLPGPDEECKSLLVNADGTIMATVTKAGKAVLRNLKTGTRVNIGTGGGVGVGAVTADGKRMAFGNRSGDVLVYDVTKPAEPVKIITGNNNRLMDMAFCPDGSKLAVCDLKKRVIVYDTKTWKTLSSAKCSFVQRALAFAGPDRLITAGIGKKVRIWDLKAGLTESKTLSGHTFGVRCMSLSKDGKKAITGSDDMTVCLWDLEKGMLTSRLDGHASLISGVAFISDTRAVSTAMDGKLIYWDLTTGKAVRDIEVCDDGVNALALTATTVLAAGRNGKLYAMSLKALGK